MLLLIQYTLTFASVLLLVALGCVGYAHQHYYTITRVVSWTGKPSAYLFVLSDYLFFAGLLLLTFAIRVSPAGEYHPTWGDRSDGRKIRTLAPMAQITAYFQVERNTCSNLFEESFEISNIDRYIRRSGGRASPISASPMCCWPPMSGALPGIPSSTGLSPARRSIPVTRIFSTAWWSRRK